jgi:hypothetical protein
MHNISQRSIFVFLQLMPCRRALVFPIHDTGRPTRGGGLNAGSTKITLHDEASSASGMKINARRLTTPP